MQIKIPRYLKKGDTIGITLPAGYMSAEKLATCIATLQDWGYRVMVGKTVGSASTSYFSGTDNERLEELQAMLDDDSIDAILCGRGGYGTNRIIDDLNWQSFRKNPKWIIGFSDITVLHCHLLTKLNTASMHAPMGAAFNDGEQDNEYIQSLAKAIKGRKGSYKTGVHVFNKKGVTQGQLVGGNLSLLVNMIGTPSDFKTEGRILFIEEIGEYIYSIDRMMRQLERSGKLKSLAGLIVGGITDVKDTDRPFGQTPYEVIRDIISKYNFPVSFGFPVSHDRENYALKVGLDYKLKVANHEVSLLESNVFSGKN